MKKNIYIVFLLSISLLFLIASLQCSTDNRYDNLDTAKLYYDSAYQCLKINDYFSALPKLIKTVELVESLPEDMDDEELHLTSRAYYQMGLVFQNMLVNAYALETALRASQYQDLRHDTAWMLYTKIRIAEQHQIMKQTDSLDYYLKQIDQLSDSVKYPDEYYIALGIMANNYYYKHVYDTAFMLIREKMKYKQRHNMTTLADSVSLGILMFHSPYKYQSKPYLSKTFDMIERNPFVSMRDMGLPAFLLSKLYEEEGNSDSVVICNKLIPEFVDNMSAEKSDEMNAKRMYEQYKTERDRHLNELKMQKEKKKNRNITIFTTIVLLILIGFAFLMKKIKQQQEIVPDYDEKWQSVEQSELLQRIKSKLITDNAEKITVKNIDKYNDRNLSTIDLLGLRHLIDTTYNGLVTRLTEQYPDLNITDIYCCCLSMLGLTTSELAVLLGVKYSAVSNRLTKIKKILHTEEDISDFMMKYYSEKK